MKITIENHGKKYQLCKCGKNCSFAKMDCKCPGAAKGNWFKSHCTEDCYLPKWWTKSQDSAALLDHGTGLMEIK